MKTNQVLNFNFSKEQTMSSREIAELTGKEHRSVLRDIDNLNISYKEMGLHKVVQGCYTHPNTGTQQHREYLLTRMQTFDLMTGYSAPLRIKVNRRWEELENRNHLALPQTYAEALRELAGKVEENEKQRLLIEEQKPKVLFTDAVIGSKSSCLIGELAKIIAQNGYEIGQNRLFKWLRDNGYLGRRGENYNIPNRQCIEQGLFELKKGIRSGNDGVMHTTITPKVTGKGQVYFVNKFLKELEVA